MRAVKAASVCYVLLQFNKTTNMCVIVFIFRNFCLVLCLFNVQLHGMSMVVHFNIAMVTPCMYDITQDSMISVF